MISRALHYLSLPAIPYLIVLVMPSQSLILWVSFVLSFSYIFSPSFSYKLMVPLWHWYFFTFFTLSFHIPLNPLNLTFLLYLWSLSSVQQPTILFFSFIPLLSSLWSLGFPHFRIFLFWCFFFSRLLLCCYVSQRTVPVLEDFSKLSIISFDPCRRWALCCGILFFFLFKQPPQYCW